MNHSRFGRGGRAPSRIRLLLKGSEVLSNGFGTHFFFFRAIDSLALEGSVVVTATCATTPLSQITHKTKHPFRCDTRHCDVSGLPGRCLLITIPFFNQTTT